MRESGRAGAQAGIVANGADRARVAPAVLEARDEAQADVLTIVARGRDLQVEDPTVGREETDRPDQGEIAAVATIVDGMIEDPGEMSGTVTFARHLRHPRKYGWSFCQR